MATEITLTDGTTVIDLPFGLQWNDEFAWSPVEHSTDYSLIGNLVVQEGTRQDGRPITLYGGPDGAWITRATLQALYAMASVPYQTLTLALWDRTFNVMFRRPALEADEIIRKANPSAEHDYAITINLMEITP
jgi:hypothetical protein